MDNPEMKHRHSHEHGPATFWASWCSPVGLGFFLLTASIAAAVALYTLLSLITGIMAIAHPTPSYSYPSSMDMPSDMEMGTSSVMQ